MKKLFLLLLLIITISMSSQPQGEPLNNQNHPACNTPNPPFWCNVIPIDTYIYVLIGAGLFLGGYWKYRQTIKLKTI